MGRPPFSSYANIEGARGGAHGGRGGRGFYGLYSSKGYGSVHKPRMMGSGGGTASSGHAGQGGGKWHFSKGQGGRVSGSPVRGT